MPMISTISNIEVLTSQPVYLSCTVPALIRSVLERAVREGDVEFIKFLVIVQVVNVNRKSLKVYSCHLVCSIKI